MALGTLNGSLGSSFRHWVDRMLRFVGWYSRRLEAPESVLYPCRISGRGIGVFACQRASPRRPRGGRRSNVCMRKAGAAVPRSDDCGIQMRLSGFANFEPADRNAPVISRVNCFLLTVAGRGVEIRPRLDRTTSLRSAFAHPTVAKKWRPRLDSNQRPSA